MFLPFVIRDAFAHAVINPALHEVDEASKPDDDRPPYVVIHVCSPFSFLQRSCYFVIKRTSLFSQEHVMLAKVREVLFCHEQVQPGLSRAGELPKVENVSRHDRRRYTAFCGVLANGFSFIQRNNQECAYVLRGHRNAFVCERVDSA